MAQPLFDWQHELTGEELSTIRAVVARFQHGQAGEAPDIESVVAAAQAACEHSGNDEFLADHQAAIAAAARYYFEQ